MLAGAWLERQVQLPAWCSGLVVGTGRTVVLQVHDDCAGGSGAVEEVACPIQQGGRTGYCVGAGDERGLQIDENQGVDG